MIWDVYQCPRCGDDAPMAVMSLVARSKCGAVYVQNGIKTGWYASMEDYSSGAERLTPETPVPDGAQKG